MPNDQYGFTGQELLNSVISYIGNTSVAFASYMTEKLPLAEFRFCKAHDWRFLHKDDLHLSVVNGTTDYTLNIASLGFNMAADDVETITDVVNGRVLKKVTLKDIRRFDPKNDQGTTTTEITHWCPINDQNIRFYPPIFESVQLTVDGKVTPGALSTLSNYPTIPYKYQETFLEYLYAIALDKENDDRAAVKKQEVANLVKADIINDMSSIGDVDSPRLRLYAESYVDGVGGASEQDWLNYLFR